MASIKKKKKTQEVTNVGKDVEKLCTVGTNVKQCRHCVKQYYGLSKKSKLELPNDTAILLLSIYTKELKAAFQRDICTCVFVTALFKIAKN